MWPNLKAGALKASTSCLESPAVGTVLAVSAVVGVCVGVMPVVGSVADKPVLNKELEEGKSKRFFPELGVEENRLPEDEEDEGGKRAFEGSVGELPRRPGPP